MRKSCAKTYIYVYIYIYIYIYISQILNTDISQILNFNEKHGNMPIYKILEKSWILNILIKEYIFLYSKRKFFFDV